LHLTVNTPTTGDTTATVCGSFDWYEQTGLVQSGDYTRTLVNAAGCDSVVTLHLTVNTTTVGDTTATVCGSFDWYEQTGLAQSGDYTRTLVNAAGCDSVVTLHLTVNTPTTGDTTATVCGSFDWYEQTGLVQSGDYTRTLVNAAGCDSVVTLHLTVNTPTTGDTTATICGSFDWYEQTGLVQSGDYTRTLVNAAGCDSVVTLHLTVNTPTTGDTTATVCGSFDWYEQTGLAQSGDYTRTLVNAAGCDSVVTLHLTINPSYAVTDAQTICENELPYPWNGVTFNAAGTQNVTLTAANGCDSVVTMTLTVNPSYAVTDAQTICESQLPYPWNGVTFNAAGTQNVTLTAANGCDSVVTMTLTVNPTYAVTDAQTICESQLPYPWNGVTFNAAGTQNVTLTAANGCDSVVTMTLTVNPSYAVTDAQTICESQLPYPWNGVTFNAAGTQNVTLTAANGCDSVVTMTLTVNPTYAVTDAQTICASELPYTWNGVTFNAAGTQNVTLTAANGCDSVVTMTLTVNPTYAVTDAQTICESELPYAWNGVTFNAAGSQNVTLQTVNGCDSVVTMTLTVNPTYAVTDAQTICASELPYAWNGVTFNAAGTQNVTLQTVNGCDSVVTMTLTVNPTYNITETRGVCPSDMPYTWNGVVFNAAGAQTVTLQTANGCDSVVTMILTVNQTHVTTDSRTVCQSELPYTWNGVVFNTASVQTANLQDMNGCDSTVIMTLTVNPTYNITETHTVCESELPYTWHNLVFNAAGSQSLNLQTVNGCDSVITMTLTVNPTFNVTDEQAVCESELPYVWNGITFTEAGTQTVTLQSSAGCDSVVTMTLTIKSAQFVDFADIACESYEWNGQSYTASGEYTQTFTAANGCDSVVTLHLTINHAVSSEFAVETADSCYSWNGHLYCESGDYTQTLTAANGCDSVVTLHLTITVGIDDHNGFAFNVYPNPTNGIVNVQCTMHNGQVGAMAFHVFDAYGKLVDIVAADTHGSSEQTTQIDLSGFAAGVYFVKAVANGNVVAVRKVVKR
jgi:hypothetical protein